MTSYSAQSARNKNAHDFLGARSPYLHWQIAALFSSALHLSNIELRGIEKPDSHRARSKPECGLPSMAKDCLKLKSLSEQSVRRKGRNRRQFDKDRRQTVPKDRKISYMILSGRQDAPRTRRPAVDSAAASARRIRGAGQRARPSGGRFRAAAPAAVGRAAFGRRRDCKDLSVPWPRGGLGPGRARPPRAPPAATPAARRPPPCRHLPRRLPNS